MNAAEVSHFPTPIVHHPAHEREPSSFGTSSTTDDDPVRLALRRYAVSFRLSPQEERLLECAVYGMPDKCAAATLDCSRHTVGTYWQRIFAKTGMRPQRQVLAHLFRFGFERRDKSCSVMSG